MTKRVVMLSDEDIDKIIMWFSWYEGGASDDTDLDEDEDLVGRLEESRLT